MPPGTADDAGVKETANMLKCKGAMRALAIASLIAAPIFAQNLTTLIDNQLSGLLEIYKDIHVHPELSHQESRTSALLANELRKAGYTVTERVGKYPDGSQAYGVVAVLENGPGPRLLIRADMDALPVVEETGLSYASHVRVKNATGEEVGVMHACGHDVHVTTLIGTARALTALKNQWHGTVVLVGQPSEEANDGAQAMLADGLYKRFNTAKYGDRLSFRSKATHLLELWGRFACGRLERKDSLSPYFSGVSPYFSGARGSYQ
jgi:hippurate hydrolase